MTTTVASEPSTIDASALSTEALVATVESLFGDYDTAFNKLRDFAPEILELHNRFKKAPRGNAGIAGCRTWKQFCEKKLNRQESTIRMMFKHWRDEKVLNPVPNKKDWRKQLFGDDCEERHKIIGDELLSDHVIQAFYSLPPGCYSWHGWAPWKPVGDTQKSEYKPVEDRYRFSLYLSASEIKQLSKMWLGRNIK
jgi:hypothetical protein